MDTRHIKINDYDYNLPEERIAKFPLANRDHSKLLIYKHGDISEDLFYNLPNYLPKQSLMVFNNTKVIQARIHFRKETGALIEIFLKRYFVIADKSLTLSASLHKEKTNQSSTGTNYWVDFDWDNDNVNFAEILEVIGELPIPPYLNRETQDSDKQTYQTVYSKIKGSVAAPTAGLHFTNEVLHAIDERGIEREELTLHVGAGTFKPVKSEKINQHEMHTEYIVVHRHTLINLLKYGCNAIAVGTTSVRTLESLYYIGVKLEQNPDASEDELHVNQWEPYEQLLDGDLVKDITAERALQNILNWLDKSEVRVLHGSTQIIIAPGFKYKIVKMLITNFHQPQSTLLLLVSAFVNGDWKCIYDYALTHDFRFLSYGDSSLLIP